MDKLNDLLAELDDLTKRLKQIAVDSDEYHQIMERLSVLEPAIDDEYIFMEFNYEPENL